MCNCTSLSKSYEDAVVYIYIYVCVCVCVYIYVSDGVFKEKATFTLRKKVLHNLWLVIGTHFTQRGYKLKIDLYK